MKKIVFIKKILGIIMLFAPLVSTLSCSSGVFDKKLVASKTIRFGMRAEDAASWKPIIDAFEDKLESMHYLEPEKYPVPFKFKIVVVGDQKASYALWGATGMPDITLADPGVATFEKKQGGKWFHPIVPVEFLGNKNNDKYKMFEDQRGINFSSEGEDISKNGFFESAFSPYKNGVKTAQGHDQLVALPYQYGPSVISLNKLFLDQTKTIKIYLPSIGGVKMVYDTNIKATPKNIKQFIADSANKDNSLKVIKDSEGKTIKGWSGYGPGNMYQRIASIGQSIISDLAKSKGVYGWAKDIGLVFEIIASSPKEKDVKGDIIQDGIVNDDVIQQIFTEGGYIDEFAKQYIYDNYLGYFKDASGYAAPPVVKSQNGEAEMMRDQQAMILLGKKWSKGFFTKQWKGSKSVEESILSIPVPYGTANMDGLGISKEVSGFKLKASKMFIKLAMSMHKNNNSNNPFAYLVSRDIDKEPNDPLAIKALPTSSAARLYLRELAEKSSISQNAKDNYFAAFGMGQKINDGKIIGEADLYNGIGGFFGSASSKGFQEILTKKVSKKFVDWMKKSKEHLSIDKAAEIITTGMKDAYLEFSLFQ